ncbi:MAG: hypothetical protein WD025_01910 [Bacteriovoracaceae bacterium]
MMKNFVLLLLVTFLFTACGGGGLSEVELRDSSNAAPSPISGALTGTAATGAPAANAIVRVNCKTGGDNGLKKGLTDAFGKWSIAMGDCGGPYVVRVKGAAAGKSVDILSVADDEDVGGIVNVTPITHLISSNVLGNADPDTAFSQVANFTKNDIQTAQGKVRNALENVIKAVTKNADVSNVDLINTAFATDHSGLDGILDAVDIQVTGNNSVNVQVVGEAAIRVDPTDDNDLDAKAASIVADETKVDNLLASYGSVGALLDGLISYI